MKTKLLLLWGLLSVWTLNLSAATIAGTIYDATTGQPVRGASVIAIEIFQQSSTNAQGQYFLDDIPAGTYTVRIFKANYEVSDITDVVVGEGQTTRLNFELPRQADADIPDEPALDELDAAGADTPAPDSSREAPSGEDIIQLDAFAVTADAVVNRDLELNSMRKTSLTSISPISSDDFSKFAAGDAAEALSRVTGVSIADGKFAVVRGLNDRYSNTQLNGLPLPSPDPERQAVQLDLFPSDLIDNIVVNKNFIPSLPGDTSGGSVNIQTSTIPFERTASVEFSIGLSEAAMQADYYPTYDDPGNSKFYTFGSYERADVGENPFMQFYLEDGSARPAFDFGVTYGDRFDLDGRPLGVVAGLNYDQSVGYREGFTQQLQARRYFFGNPATPDAPLGNVNTQGFGPGAMSDGRLDQTDTGRFQLFESTEEVAISALLGLSYALSDNHTIAFTAFGTRNGIDIAQAKLQSYFSPELSFTSSGPAQSLLVDDVPLDRADEPFVRNVVGRKVDFVNEESLYYQERVLDVISLNGTSYLPGNYDLELNWAISKAHTLQDEPDFRRFRYLGRWNDELTAPQDDYYNGGFSSELSPHIERLWRTVEEYQDAAKIDTKISFDYGDNLFGELSVGGQLQHNERDVEQVDLGIENGQDFSASSTEELARLIYENDPQASPSGRSTAFGTREVNAFYFTLNLPINEQLKVVAGLRYERTNIAISGAEVDGNGNITNNRAADFYQTQVPGGGGVRFWEVLGMDDPTGFPLGVGPGTVTDSLTSGGIDRGDWIPTIGMIAEVEENMFIRLNWSATVARPSFRELMPYVSPNVESGGDLVLGNPDLKMSQVQNYELRWEWYHGEEGIDLLAISAYQKRIENPIEKQLLYNANQRQTVETWLNNPGEAKIKGLELEVSQSLGVFWEALQHLTLSTNLSYIKAEVPVAELNRILYAGGEDFVNGDVLDERFGGGYRDLEDVPTERRLFDQPEWIINFDLTYDHPDWGLKSTVAYFAISSILTGAGNPSTQGATFDRFDATYHQVDWTMRKTFGEAEQWTLKFAAENLTDARRAVTYGDKDEIGNLIYETYYRSGRSYSLGLTYDF